MCKERIRNVANFISVEVRRTTNPLLLFVLSILILTQAGGAQSAASKPILVGYFGQWALYSAPQYTLKDLASNHKAAMLDQLNYAQAFVTGGHCSIADPNADLQLGIYRRVCPRLKVIEAEPLISRSRPSLKSPGFCGFMCQPLSQRDSSAARRMRDQAAETSAASVLSEPMEMRTIQREWPCSGMVAGVT